MSIQRAAFGIFLASVLNSSALGTAGANPNSVQKLYGVCKSPNPTVMFRCAAYIQGFSTMMHIVGEASAEAGLSADKRDALRAYGICHSASVPDMIRVFLNWTERHPQEWERDGEYGVLASLKEEWPCR